MTSFEFKWDNKIELNSGKSSGKAFARKKNNKNLSEIADNQKTNLFRKKPIKQVDNLKLLKNNSISKTNAVNKVEPHQFIKRKGKKDKIATKNIAKSLEFEEKTSKIPKASQQKPAIIHHSLFSEKYKNVYVNTDIKGKSVVEKVFSAGRKISELDIHKHILSNLEKNNFDILTNVQEKSIPTVLSGQNVLVSSWFNNVDPEVDPLGYVTLYGTTAQQI